MGIFRNRKAVVAFIICACLVMGIGYANLTDYLTTNGHLQSPADYEQTVFDSNIKFQQIVSSDNCTDVQIINDDTVLMDVHTLALQGDRATATFRIVNEGAVDAVIYKPSASAMAPTSQITADIADYYEVAIDWTGDQTLLGTTTAPHNTVDVTITVTLKKEIDKNIEGDFTITFHAIDKDTYDASSNP